LTIGLIYALATNHLASGGDDHNDDDKPTSGVIMDLGTLQEMRASLASCVILRTIVDMTTVKAAGFLSNHQSRFSGAVPGVSPKLLPPRGFDSYSDMDIWILYERRSYFGMVDPSCPSVEKTRSLGLRRVRPKAAHF
jgi:hypothetical protein